VIVIRFAKGDELMSSLDKAFQTQIDNIQKKTGNSLDELSVIVRKSGLTRHGEIRDYLKRELGLGHGDANALVHAVFQSDGQRAAQGKSTDQVLDEIYSGTKAHLRPIHEKLMKEINKLGEFEIAPKKGYVSLRRKRQFAMLGPKTNTRFELGINAKDLKKSARLLEQPKGSMCNYIINLTEVKDVDSELVGWIKSAYEGAG
ncbi:MAG TPA: DUF4287 domain-containing protein, partial [Anaerolineales bacterium]|nr:DUF4287 domain-containing protein [Anaerolineales bacterium]